MTTFWACFAGCGAGSLIGTVGWKIFEDWRLRRHGMKTLARMAERKHA